MGRQTKTRIPTTAALLQPQSTAPTKVKQNIQLDRERQKLYYDRGAKRLPAIKQGDAIRIHTPHGWKPAVYVAEYDATNSHIVKSGSQARLYRSSRRMLLRTSEAPQTIEPEPPGYVPMPRNEAEATTNQPTATINMQAPPPVQRQPEPYIIRSRSGRQIKPPAYLNEYVRK